MCVSIHTLYMLICTLYVPYMSLYTLSLSLYILYMTYFLHTEYFVLNICVKTVNIYNIEDIANSALFRILTFKSITLSDL